ncbi:MAG: hypothetical protein ACKVQJ_07915 [Pyrinomonadaceae bacterium]
MKRIRPIGLTQRRRIFKFSGAALIMLVAFYLGTHQNFQVSSAESLETTTASRWTSKSSVKETSPGVWQVVSTGTNIAAGTNYNSTVRLTANGSIAPTDFYNLGDVAAGESITKTWAVTTGKGVDFSGEVTWHGCVDRLPCL